MRASFNKSIRKPKRGYNKRFNKKAVVFPWLSGSQRKGEPKQVIFSDGIRPGGDLTEEVDGPQEARFPPRRTGRAQKKVERVSQGKLSLLCCCCFLPCSITCCSNLWFFSFHRQWTVRFPTDTLFAIYRQSSE